METNSTSNKPLVSVVIPAYNHERYIQETIRSIIEQTYKNIELIIIDDGSTDSTWQKMQEMKNICENRFVFTHFETKSNEGTCATLNKLLNLTKGSYIFFIASDDVVLNDAINTEVNFLETNNDYAMVVGDNKFIDSNSNIVYLDNYGKTTTDINKATYSSMYDIFTKQRPDVINNFGSYESLYKGNYIPNGYMVRKTIFDKTGKFTKDAPLEDYWLMLQIAKYYKIKYINETFCYYRRHGNNTINNSKKMHYMTEQTLNWEYKFVKTLKTNNDIDSAVFKNNRYCKYTAHKLYSRIKYYKSSLRKFLIDHNLYRPKDKK